MHQAEDVMICRNCGSSDILTDPQDYVDKSNNPSPELLDAWDRLLKADMAAERIDKELKRLIAAIKTRRSK